MEPELSIEPTGAATIVNENFVWLTTRTQALENLTDGLKKRTAALGKKNQELNALTEEQRKTSLLLNARTLASATKLEAIAVALAKLTARLDGPDGITTRLKETETALAKQTAKLDALVGNARSDSVSVSDSDTETDDEAGLGNESMAVDALRW